MKVLLAASECVPFSKTGGLADVVGALSKALAHLGHEVSVILPYYRSTQSLDLSLAEAAAIIRLPMADREASASVIVADAGNGVTAYFIKRDEYYDRAELYRTPEGDYPDNAERFIFFSRAIVAAITALGLEPDIIHCHDWQTGLVPALVKQLDSRTPILPNLRSVYTIHNLAYQGTFWHLDMPMTGLPWSAFSPDGVEFYGKLNLMKAGIVFSDIINTVSCKYSQEIQTDEFGCGLDGVLRTRQDDLYGILNGVDYENWDPSTDRYIAKRYSADNLSGKTACRAGLIKTLGLSLPKSAPLVGMISRLTDQKGFDILAKAMDKIMALGIGFVLLGTGEKRYQDLFAGLSKRYPKKAAIRIAFDNRLAHRIEAGCDMFLMPSRFEPCGLNQMYSLRYGTVPVVRATGGLDDTIDNFNVGTGKGTGFKFAPYTSEALVRSLKRAVGLFANRDAWKRLMRNGMQSDFSWNASAEHYVDLYERTLAKPPRPLPAPLFA